MARHNETLPTADQRRSSSARTPRSGVRRHGPLRTPGEPVAVAPAGAYRRPFSRGRVALSAFAMLACAGIALVSVCDPYAGATAAPFYQKPEQAPTDSVQRFAIQGGYVLVDVKRDRFAAVKPVVEVHQTAPAVGGGSGGAAGDVTVGAAATPTYTTPTGTAQAYAAGLVAARGWGAGEFSCLVNLWNQESSWNTHAYNPSGAYGIPQALPGSKMATFGADWQNDYRVQIKWGLSYISGSYGSPCGAWNSEVSRHWY